MLVAIRKETAQRELARDALKPGAPWSCPQCGDDVILKKGVVRVHHYAHRPTAPFCEHGAGESEEHLRCKLAIYDQLRVHSSVSFCEMEWDLKIARPDVFVKINGAPVAIEVQRSSLTLDQIATRTSNYATLGAAVLWVCLWREELAGPRIAPSVWEKWLHAAYFGRVYYWRDDHVVPIHFGEYRLSVPVKSWHDSDGSERTAGGYDKRSKRWRRVVGGQPLSIADDMQMVRASAFYGQALVVPSRIVWADQRAAWWTK